MLETRSKIMLRISELVAKLSLALECAWSPNFEPRHFVPNALFDCVHVQLQLALNLAKPRGCLGERGNCGEGTNRAGLSHLVGWEVGERWSYSLRADVSDRASHASDIKGLRGGGKCHCSMKDIRRDFADA